MTITPEQAQALLEDTTPAPWVYDSDYECIETADSSTVVLCNTDLAVSWGANPDTDGSLAAQAPIMAEQIAGMQWEYGIDRENLQCSHIDHPRGCRLTMWCQSLDSARDGVEIAQQSDPTARIVRRLVSKPEEIS